MNISWLRKNPGARIVTATAVVLLAFAGVSCAEPQGVSEIDPVTTIADITGPASATTVPPIGEPYVGPGPQKGDVVGVVGVAHDEVVTVWSGPDIGSNAVTTLGPVAQDLPLLSQGRLLPTGVWYEIDAQGGSGWVDASLIGMFGATENITDEVVGAIGTPPAAASMVELGSLVADLFVSEESEVLIVLVALPTETVSTSVTYDVTGFRDDSLLGYRLVVQGSRSVAGGGYELLHVDRTAICSRGVTPDGICL